MTPNRPSGEHKPSSNEDEYFLRLDAERWAEMSSQGSIKKDASGNWSFVVDLLGVGGKRKQAFRRGFPTKKAAQEALTKLLGEQQRGTYVAPTRSTLGEFMLDEWLPARRSSLRESTAASCEQMIRSYVVTFAFVTFRLVEKLLLPWNIAPQMELDTFLAFACWSVPLLFAEPLIQLRRIRRR